MNKHIHNAILHLAKAVLCMMMILVLALLLIVAFRYPTMTEGIVLFIGILTGMMFAQLGFFVGYNIRGNEK